MASLIPKMPMGVAVESAGRTLPLAIPVADCDDVTTADATYLDGVGAGIEPTPSDAGIQLRRRLVLLDSLGIAAAWIPRAVLSAGAGPVRLAVSCVLAGLVTLFAMRSAGLYHARVCAMRSAEAVRTVLAAFTGAAVFAGLSWLTGRGSTTSALLMTLPVAAGVLILRWCFARWLRERRAEGSFLRTVLLVGTNDDAVALWTTLSSEPELGYRIAAVVGAPRDDAPWAGLPTAATAADLPSIARGVGANGAILVASALGDEGHEVVKSALSARLHVQVWPGLSGLTSRRLRMTPASGVPLIYVEPHQPPKWQVSVKRSIDVALAAFGVMISAPVLLSAGLLIKLEDKGPVLYRSTRIGRHGRPITVVKLRTMIVGAAAMTDQLASLNERTDGPLFKSSKDPRETRIGRVLRATSIDEIPQLWNVLNGSMSLVGPRPALPSEVERFDPELHRRHEMRPGITGLWQIEARDNPSFSAYRRLDLAYVDSWSLGMDIAILGTTIHAVVSRGIREIFRRQEKSAARI